MYSECRHIMPNGWKCSAPALRGKPFCYFHTRLHGFAAKPAAAPGAPLKLPILEDRSAIQVALSQVLDALGSSQLDPRRAGLFLYALQIASQNVDHRCDIIPCTTVHSITHTAAGDELGPEVVNCDIPEDCSTCDETESCVDFIPGFGPEDEPEEDAEE
jgi:hypothetical protein